MTTDVMPIIQCDGDDGFCLAWSIDYYTQGADRASGVKITRTHPAPYWVAGSDDEHYCPTHSLAHEEQE